MPHASTSQPSRRKFLSTTTAAAVGSVFAAPLVAARRTAAADGISRTLRVGLVGCGNRGTGAAAQALKADPHVELHAVGDVFADRIESGLQFIEQQAPGQVKVDAARRFLGFDAFQRVIDTDVDAVLFATPPAFRPQQLQAAVVAGKHAFCECIAGVDAPGIRTFLAAAEEAERKRLSVVSGFCWRYDNGARAVAEQIRAGRIGQVRAVYATYYRESFDRYYGKERKPEWSDLEWQIRDWPDFLWLGGDLNIGLSGGHSVDKMAWWFDDEMPVKAVGVGGRQFPGEGNTFDHCEVNYEYANGVRGFLGVRTQNGCHNENCDYIIGTTGVCTIGRGPVPEITGENPWKYEGPRNAMHQTEQDEFIASIRSGRPINDGRRMAHTSLMAIMGRMAAYTGREITWDEALSSQERLVPEHLDWNTPVELTPPPMPGVTKFA